MHVYRRLFPHHVPYLPSRFSKLSHQASKASCSLQFGTASAAVRAVARVRGAAPENFSVFVLHIPLKSTFGNRGQFSDQCFDNLKICNFCKKTFVLSINCEIIELFKIHSKFTWSGSIGINHDQYSKLTKVKMQKLSYNNQS